MGKFNFLPRVKLTTADSFIILIITMTSIVSRFWLIYNPDCVVFDEVHFGNFTNWYIKNEFFYDIHPPLGKLIMAYIAKLGEYDGEIDFEKLYGNQYDRPDFVIIRMVPALFSSLCSPLIYLTMRFVSFSKIASFVSAFFIIFDTSLLTEQRFILSDGMLHFFTCLFLAVSSYTSQLKAYSARWDRFMIYTAITLGFACSCKNTAWGLCFYIAFIEINNTFRYRKALDPDSIFDVIYRGCHHLGGFIAVYLLTFFVHFIVLPYNGQGTGYIPDMMRRQLVNKNAEPAQLWAKRLRYPELFFRSVTLAVNMHIGNMGITQFHPYQSRPGGWPFLTDCWVAFWGKGDSEVNCMGNVFIYYIGFFSMVLSLFFVKSFNYRTSLNFVVGYLFSYLPFFLIPRSVYLYHYLIPLMFLCCLTGTFLDLAFPPKIKGIVGAAFCLLALFGFYLWSPFSYGTPHFDQEISVWTDNWIYGDKYHRELSKKNR